MGGSLYLIYSNFIRRPSSPNSVTNQTEVPETAAQSLELRVLPFGSQLDFALLHKYNPDGRVYNYAQVNATQIGVGISNLILPGKTPAQK